MTLSEKICLLDKLKELPCGMSQRRQSDLLNIPRATLQKRIANEPNLREKSSLMNSVALKKKRNRAGKDHEVETALKLWFDKASGRNLPLSGPILKEKAASLAMQLCKTDFKVTDGWFSRWKARNNIVYKRAHGESQSADHTGASIWCKDTIPQLLQAFHSQDIYNADETGLYFRATPDGSLVFRSTALKGSKKAMERVTLLVCANMNGSDRRKLVLIGKSKKPRCRKNIDLKSLTVHYVSNKTAWMTSTIFTSWLNDWDQELAKTNRHILILLDNPFSS